MFGHVAFILGIVALFIGLVVFIAGDHFKWPVRPAWCLMGLGLMLIIAAPYICKM